MSAPKRSRDDAHDKQDGEQTVEQTVEPGPVETYEDAVEKGHTGEAPDPDEDLTVSGVLEAQAEHEKQAAKQQEEEAG